jgi:hypothetical protein
LRWYESNDSDIPNFAPLLLLPVQLSKRLQGRRAVYSLKAVAETPEINLSLRELMLRNSPDVSRHLPDFDDETDGLESYFDKVCNAIEGLNRWRIDRYLTLGHFAFGRLAMYEDLASENWQEPPINHPLVESLLRGSDAEGNSDLFFASDYDLDDETIENAAPILINDADASQHSAVVDVMNGKNIVVEGPPGTGKSQTITNIIANALYANQSVLFLADKLAALEVVKDRLDAAGLGHFCLELHSDKAHPKPIIESLKQRYQLIQHAAAEPNWRQELQRVRNARARVRDYLSALHKRADDDENTPFRLIWSTIAECRNLKKEFEAARRTNLESLFSKGSYEIERCKDALELYVQLVKDYEQRYGALVDAPWFTAGISTATDNDPDIIADKIRDAYAAANALSESLTTSSSSIGVELPAGPSAIKGWLESISRLPQIPEDFYLPVLEPFSLDQIEAATRLAAERIELISQNTLDLGPHNIETIAELGRQIAQSSLADLSPAEIVDRAGRADDQRKSLVESLNVFSPLIAAFRLPAPNVQMVREMAQIIRFATTIPSQLDPFLGFNRSDTQATLEAGARQLDDISSRDRALRVRLNIPNHRWPPLEDLRVAAEVLSAAGLDRIRVSLNGKRRRATRAIKALGGSPVAATDIREIIAQIEAQRAFAMNSAFAAAAGSFWSELSTPLKQLIAVLQLRKRFGVDVNSSSDFVKTVHRALFSTNSKVASALRNYAVWSERLLAQLSQWPDSFEDVPLDGAAERINSRSATLKSLASQIQELKLSKLTVRFVEIIAEIERKKRVSTLEASILVHPVLQKVGERAWLAPVGCQELRLSSEIVKAVAIASPQPEVRARLFSKGSAEFRRLLDTTTTSLNQTLAEYQNAQNELSKIGSTHGRDESHPQAIADQLRSLVSSLPSLREWLGIVSRRRQLESYGVAGLLKAFADAKLPHDRLPETLAAMAFHHRATRARKGSSVLQQMKGIDLENERSRFVAADEALKKLQRDAVRMKLLKLDIPTGNGTGPKRDWTDLQCLRNEFTKQTKHLPIRRLLGRSGHAVQALKPCFMMSPLSLAKFLPSQSLRF